MGAGGPPHRRLEAIRALYPLSLHGVGLSIGSPDRWTAPISPGWPASPSATSRPSSPSIWPGRRTRARSSTIFCPCPTPTRRSSGSASTSTSSRRRSGGRCCSKTPRPMSRSPRATMSETDFLAEIVRRTGCGLLLDVNNVFVSATNHGFDPYRYLADFPLAAVGEIHLAGYADDRDDAGLPLLIDAHDSPVRDAVWALYRRGDPQARADADPRRMGQRPAALAGAARRSAPGRARDGRSRRAERRSRPMPFEATIAAFAAALCDPAAPPPAGDPRTAGRARRAPLRGLSQQCRGRADRRARSALSGRAADRRAGRVSARWRAPSLAAHKPRSPVMIAYGDDFPDFVAAVAGARPALSRRRGPAGERLGRGLSRRGCEGGRPRRSRRRSMPDGPAGRADRISSGRAASPLRDAGRLDLGRPSGGARTRAAARAGRKTRSSRAPTPTSRCASCRRGA